MIYYSFYLKINRCAFLMLFVDHIKITEVSCSPIYFPGVKFPNKYNWAYVAHPLSRTREKFQDLLMPLRQSPFECLPNTSPTSPSFAKWYILIYVSRFRYLRYKIQFIAVYCRYFVVEFNAMHFTFWEILIANIQDENEHCIHHHGTSVVMQPNMPMWCDVQPTWLLSCVGISTCKIEFTLT